MAGLFFSFERMNREAQVITYVNDLVNLGFSHIDQQHDVSAVEEVLNQLKDLKDKYRSSRTIQSHIESKYLKLQLPYLLNSKQAGRIEQEFIPAFEAFLPKLPPKDKLLNLYNVTVSFFTQGHFEHVPARVAQIEEAVESYRSDIKIAALLLRLIAVFELEELDEFTRLYKKLRQLYTCVTQ